MTELIQICNKKYINNSWHEIYWVSNSNILVIITKIGNVLIMTGGQNDIWRFAKLLIKTYI